MAAYDDIWTWDEIVAALDEHLPTTSVRPGLARVTLPAPDDDDPRVVHLVMTPEEFADMTVVEGDDLGVIVDRVVGELRAMPPQRQYLAYFQYSLHASRSMPPPPEEIRRAYLAGPGGRDEV